MNTEHVEQKVKYEPLAPYIQRLVPLRDIQIVYVNIN